MRNLFKAFTLGCVLSLSAFAAGVNGGGNGGDIILCIDQNHPDNMKLLDYYEAEKRGLVIEKFGEELTEYEIVEELILRLEKKSPRRAAIYRSWIKEFQQRVQFVSSPLIDIQDAGSVTIADECFLKQFAIQTPVIDENDKVIAMNYTVREKYWKESSAQTRAAIIMHEMVLREAKTILKHDDSSTARKVNGYIASMALEEHGLTQFNLTLYDYQFKSYEVLSHFFSEIYTISHAEVLYQSLRGGYLRTHNPSGNLKKFDFHGLVVYTNRQGEILKAASKGFAFDYKDYTFFFISSFDSFDMKIVLNSDGDISSYVIKDDRFGINDSFVVHIYDSKDRRFGKEKEVFLYIPNNKTILTTADGFPINFNMTKKSKKRLFKRKKEEETIKLFANGEICKTNMEELSRIKNCN